MTCSYGLNYSRLYSQGWDKAKQDFKSGQPVPRFDGSKGDAWNEGYEDSWINSQAPRLPLEL